MTLIKSISGIRGTIGGHAGEGLNPLDIVKFTSAYATLIRKTTTNKSNKIVVGRDARISGEMVKNVVCGTLMGMGFDVVNIGLASTPTTELAVTMCGFVPTACKIGRFRFRIPIQNNATAQIPQKITYISVVFKNAEFSISGFLA